ncbi:GH3 auxin-responsive promoter family protein [Exilibacterium tricleocarpae]|uniref:GH3 auxin-responsive promoter family protein n=1 Tax=Exilibacterium tricleocarpae TaxID=2591008 RepID=A0A545SNF2_9GAMM|nr:GH3 auxin-responsive promoter family protein [Exilibacterium tricleocarpae]TQV66508.1 GH3 auxin-responsive promoter family protein [Exilibacterium tricleocarpae]
MLNHQTSKIAHKLAKLASYNGCRKFIRGTQQLEATQQGRLKSILHFSQATEIAQRYHLHTVDSLQSFRDQVPVTDYSDWSSCIERQRSTGLTAVTNAQCDRYQPTSGSTSAIKWIPYTNVFLDELDAAISPWMWDMYCRYPGISKGSHYWSLSWVPTSLRKQISGNVNDDMKLLPLWKRLFMSAIMAVTDEVSQTNTSEQSLFSTLCYLAADRSLSMISVWSPTFAINLLENMGRYRNAVAETLATGEWNHFAGELQAMGPPKSSRAAQLLAAWNGKPDPEFVAALWPNLALVSSWDTSTSARWAKQLRGLFQRPDFQGKGLWATEGVITIPFSGKYPLAVNSHFYEFMDLQDNNIYSAWQLRKNQIVKPLLTTGSGLMRYAMKDKMQVVDFMNECPCFEFLGRMDGTDMVGEKMSNELAAQLLSQVEPQSQAFKPISLVAIPAASNRPPFYLLLCEGTSRGSDERDRVAAMLEEGLSQHFHYKLARDLTQLGPAQCVVTENAWELYQERCRRRGMVIGNIKVEPLVCWDDQLPDEFDSDSASVEPIRQPTAKIA